MSQVLIYTAFVFAASMACHDTLVAKRPGPGRLTAFYFALSAGSVGGALFVTFAAPHLFQGYFELHTAILATTAIALCYGVFGSVAAERVARAGLAVTTALFLYPVLPAAGQTLLDRMPILYLLAVLPVTLAFSRRRLIGVGTVLVLLAAVLFLQARSYLESAVVARRSFFGVLRVEQEGDLLRLRHGATEHGFQYQDRRRRMPTAYYGRSSGIGRLFLSREPGKPLSVGVIGLGTGAIAAWGRRGDSMTFYELDPDVIALSQGKAPLFTYLRDSDAAIRIVPGDARLSLEREWREHGRMGYDLIIIDAFSGDAIPVHLLTIEALRLYLANLIQERGILAFHITNRYLDLRPVLAGAAVVEGLAATWISNEQPDPGEYRSDWLMLSRSNSPMVAEVMRKGGKSLPRFSDKRLWTDDYSSLLGLIRR